MSSCRRFRWAVVATTVFAPAVCAALPADDGGGLVGWVESTRGVPVAGALVSIFGKGIRGGSLVTLADNQGQFVLPSLPAGSYTLRAVGQGHEPSAARHVTVLPNRDALYTLSLTPVSEKAEAATAEATDSQAELRGRHGLEPPGWGRRPAGPRALRGKPDVVRRTIGRASGTLIIGVLSLLSAGFCGDEPIQVKPGEPFELRIGQKASVAGGDLVLTFLAVPQDSRCPKGEQCIVAGKARVSLEAAPKDGVSVALELDTTGESEGMDISGFQISLVSLSPYPVSGRPIGPHDYLVKLSVRKP